MPEELAALRVLVTTARGAFPLEGAAVTVSTAAAAPEARALLYAVQTDRDGLTPPLALPAPPRALSLQPGGAPPYALYTVEVRLPGYTPQAALQVPMFAGVPSVLPVQLVPLPENQAGAAPDLTSVGDPQALTRPGPRGGAPDHA